MLMRSRTGRLLMAMVLCACVATVTSSSTALAQARGNSGLPAGSGNPMADLQGQLTVLQQQTAALQTQINSLSALGQDVTTLKNQMKSLLALQDQVTTLMAQVSKQADALGTLNTSVSGLNTSVSTLNKDVSALKEQLAVLAAMQRQLAALSSQATTLSTLQGQVNALSSQLEALAAQSTSGSYESLAVYDSKDQKVGDVVGVQDSIAWVGLTIGDRAVVLQVFPQQLVGGSLYYEGTNCTGKVYIRSDATFTKGVSVFSLGAVSEPGGVIYAADPGALPFTVRNGLPSLRDKAGFCINTLSNPTVVLAKPIFMLDTMFQRPFHVR